MQGSEFYTWPIYLVVIVGAWSVIAGLLFGDLMRQTGPQGNQGKTFHYAVKSGLGAAIVVLFVLFVDMIWSVLSGQTSISLGPLLLLLALAVFLVARWVRIPPA